MIPLALVPGRNRFTLERGWQWLTSDPDWSQDWDIPGLGSALPYRRTDWRLAVDIPAIYADRCVPWPTWELRRRPPSSEYLSRFRSSIHWYVFHGPIPPAWVIAWDRNPERATPNENHDDERFRIKA